MKSALNKLKQDLHKKLQDDNKLCADQKTITAREMALLKEQSKLPEDKRTVIVPNETVYTTQKTQIVENHIKAVKNLLTQQGQFLGYHDDNMPSTDKIDGAAKQIVTKLQSYNSSTYLGRGIYYTGIALQTLSLMIASVAYFALQDSISLSNDANKQAGNCLYEYMMIWNKNSNLDSWHQKSPTEHDYAKHWCERHVKYWGEEKPLSTPCEKRSLADHGMKMAMLFAATALCTGLLGRYLARDEVAESANIANKLFSDHAASLKQQAKEEAARKAVEQAENERIKAVQLQIEAKARELDIRKGELSDEASSFRTRVSHPVLVSDLSARSTSWTESLLRRRNVNPTVAV